MGGLLTSKYRSNSNKQNRWKQINDYYMPPSKFNLVLHFVKNTTIHVNIFSSDWENFTFKFPYHLLKIAGTWCLAIDWNFLTNTSNIRIRISRP